MVCPAFRGFPSSAVLQEESGHEARAIVLTSFGQSEDSGIIHLRKLGRL